MSKVIKGFKYKDEDDEGEFDVHAFECPNCSEITDLCGDDFIWRNSRYETEHPVDCEHCDQGDFTIVRSND